MRKNSVLYWIIAEQAPQERKANNMKKFVSMLLSVLMVLGVLCTGAVAEETGSVYRTLYSGEITTLNYLYTATTNEFALAANLIDTLVEYDKYGQVQPSLAETWEVDDTGLVWTFHLRDDAKWVDSKGEVYAPVVADDFVAAAQYVLDANNASSTADIFYGLIAGAEEYYLGTSTPEEGAEPYPVMEWDTVGVKALDEHTLQYTLKNPTPYFESSLTYVCFMPVNRQFLEEKGADFGVTTFGADSILYCGAYVLSEFKSEQTRVLTANKNYWDRENVHITTIQQTYNKEAATLAPQMYRDEDIDSASIDPTIAEDWLSDPATADLIRPVRQTGFYTYFYAFNFDPQFDAAYEPENWKVVVNNENFRKSIYHGLNRVNAMLITEPDNPESIIFNTITPPDFVTLDGTDYVNIGDLAEITALGTDTFNEELALQYKATAMEELKDTATFPVKVLMPYNPGSTGWDEECLVVEQQLETLLGTDYIDIIVEAGPSTGFLGEVRRSGKYALLKCNWGPDYADPQTYTDPFKVGGSYNFPEYCVGYEEEDGTKTYNKLVDEAKAITSDMAARYEAFAKAEAYFINHAFVIPFGYGNGGYTASRIDPFTTQFAPFGISNERYKGAVMLEDTMNTDEYFDAYDAWLAEREALATAE